MPAPTLTPQEIAQLQKEAAKQQGFADALTAAIPAKAARAAELAVADGAFKKFFDYYNTDIIAKYNDERKALNGVYQAAPITEADVVGPASIDGSVRTTPTLPATDIIRIPEFDGGNTTTNPTHEQQSIPPQAVVEDQLVNGFGTGAATTALTTTPLTGASTTLSITNTVVETIAVNGIYVLIDGSNLAVIKVLSKTDTTPMMPPPPPYTTDLTIEVIVPPVGTVSAGTGFDDFLGFNNTERTNKLAADPDYQPLMDYLILQLQNAINARIPHLNNQLTALAANQDPDGAAQIATATTNVNTSKTFLTNYLLTTDISNTGLASLATERGVRSAQITARVAEIVAAYTGQTKNYYNERYTVANNRGNTSRGTLRLQIATQQSSATLTSYAASSVDAANAINDLLNP